MDLDVVRTKAAQLMPTLMAELGDLVAIPSVAFPGFPTEPVLAMAEAVVNQLQAAGAPNARLVEVPDGYPAVYAEVLGPSGAPTVLLYAHYDVQPAPLDQGWDTDPWTAVTKDDGRMYGRGVADDKSGLAIHAGTLRMFDGSPPVTIRILVEGEEETVSHLEDFVDANPQLVQCDAFFIADMGNEEVGRPALTTALRGEVSCTVTVRTLTHPPHSGVFGGAAPDALVSLIRILSRLHDDDGNTAVPGLTGYEWPDVELDEDAFRKSAGVLDGVRLVGSGSLASRVWSKASATVIGIDAPTVAAASNVLIPHATAKVSMRIAPGADAEHELGLLADHLRAAAPWGVEVEVEPIKAGQPFQSPGDGPSVTAAMRALEAAYGRPAETIGSGGTIPLIASLRKAAPKAEVILWGAEDAALSRIHASNESVDPSEIEHMVVAQSLALIAIGSGTGR